MTTLPASCGKRRVAHSPPPVLLPADVWCVIKHFFFRDLWRARFTRCVIAAIPPPIFLRTLPGYRFCLMRSALRRMWTDVEAVCVGTQRVFRVHPSPE